MSDDLKPAIDVSDIKSELSAEEFQRQLYAYFEERGLLSELRAHLRMQMIGALKDTAIGRAVASQVKQATSPKLQAINLLIAEFMLHQEYHYSLCVFSTEVPLINIFPEVSSGVIRNSCEKNADPKKWRFSHKDFLDILETLGINQNTHECLDISTRYYANSDESLLSCIVRTLHLLNNIKKANVEIDMTKVENQVDFGETRVAEWTLKNLTELLSRANISKQLITIIENHITLCIKNERDRISQEKQEEYAKLMIRLEEETNKRIDKYKRRVAEIENTFDTERKKLEDELHHTKASLKECAETLHKRFEKLEEQEKNIQIRERELQKKEEQVKRTRLVLEKEMQKLHSEKYNILELKHQLQKESEENEKSLIMDKTFLNELQKNRENFNNSFKQTCEAISETLIKARDRSQQTTNNSEVENALMKQLIRHLQCENNILRNQNREQQTRVQKLAQNASNLIKELENTEGRVINTFNGGFRTGLLPGPPLIVPSMPSLSVNTRNGLNGSNGSGEELNVRPPLFPRHYRYTSLPRDTRRRLLNRRYSNASSSDEPSPTEEVLQEARERLRHLERESNEIDKNFRDYRKKLSEDQPNSDNEYRNCFTNGIAPDRSNKGMSTNNTDKVQNRRSPPPQPSIVQNDLPSTSNGMPYFFDNFSAPNCSKTPDQNLLFEDRMYRNREDIYFQAKNSDVFNENEVILDMMNILKSPVFNDHEINNNENLNPDRENRVSNIQSANSSGFLQDVLPGTSGLSFSSVDISSENTDGSVINKKKGDFKNSVLINFNQ